MVSVSLDGGFTQRRVVDHMLTATLTRAMSTLPQPPAPPYAPGVSDATPQVLRPGQLTNAWRGVFMVGWGCVVLAMAAVWRSARTLGLSTWWLGASSTPQFLLVQLLPFLPAIGLVVLAARNIKFLPYLGIGGAIALAAVASGDIDRFSRLAVAEFAIAAAAMLVSVASFAGLLRAADDASELSAPSPPGSAPEPTASVE